MIKVKKGKNYYETEIIDKVTCDDCDVDLTNTIFFTLEIKLVQVEDQNKFIERAYYDENNCITHLCKSCTEKKFKLFNNPIKEYIEDSICEEWR